LATKLDFTAFTLIEVFDLQGKVILILNPKNQIANINTSNFANGIYVSKISTNSGTSIIRLLKK